MATPPTNLPVQLSSFIGRALEMAEVKRLLARARLVTLTGSGGCGKSRLALQVAAELVAGALGKAEPVEAYPDGVWLVDLAPLSDPSAVAQRIAAALDVREQPGQPLLATLLDRLRNQHLLLVLDNCEHLIEAAALAADTLLRGCPQLRILATSRENLRIEGETVYRVPSLQLPDAGQSIRSDELMKSDAVRLFVERAQFVRSDFALAEANALSVVEICRQLEGIPLALELAAARINVLSAEQLAARLGDRFRLLSSGIRTTLPRHQTLRAAIDWSYALLPEPEQLLLQRLSVFAGGWTLEAAEDVAKDDPRPDFAEGLGGGMKDEVTKDEGGRMKDEPIPPSAFRLHPSEVLDLLTRLVAKSLVVMEEKDGGPRYRMLETIREYAAGKLEPAASDAVHQRHMAYFVALAEAAEPKLVRVERLAPLQQMNIEYPNILAALQWALEHDTAMAVRLAGALGYFWTYGQRFNEGFEWLTRVLALDLNKAGARGKAKVLLAAGLLDIDASQAGTRSFLEQSVSLWRQVGDPWNLAQALHYLGYDRYLNGGHTGLHLLFEESASLFRELGDKESLASSLAYQARAIAYESSDYGMANALLQEARLICEELGDHVGLGVVFMHFGRIALQEADFPAARRSFTAALAQRRLAGQAVDIGISLHDMGDIETLEGRHAEARAMYEESITIAKTMGHRGFYIVGATRLGYLELTLGNLQRAAGLFQSALAVMQTVGSRAQQVPDAPLAGMALITATQSVGRLQAVRLLSAIDAVSRALDTHMQPKDRIEVDRFIAAIRKQISPAEFESAWAQGQTMTLQQAFAEARQIAVPGRPVESPPPGSQPTTALDLAGLTPRELEVLRLVALGLTNEQIADQLVVSRRTVHSHMRSIFSKLDVTTRTAAARVALEYKLV